MRKLTREKKPNTEAPTNEAVAAEAMADTEKSVPMFIMVPARSIDDIMFWLACKEQRTKPFHEPEYPLSYNNWVPMVHTPELQYAPCGLRSYAA